ncbi:LTA synthase family protein [Hymenobacter sp. BT186]|uniref:LTA synthase family protein n=1 Tax=Hymenobacter telluris TaxID=2816474 RepID=A0A939JAP5_9BACT|nr:LTA synthase family protein [Hymenobacter telluris]MBO0356455.1 LTA synthase family protein [Hymenobacter telluris]MBW3372479.1 LTA synthase family protein [Hymenobacter norwichensis]
MISPLLRLLLRRLLLLMGVYVLLRLGFYWANRSVFQEAPTGQVLLAFWHGFRYDISALLLLNVPFLGLSLVPVFSSRWQGFLRGFYLILNAIGIALNLIDTQYFKFIGRRTTNELFTITDDIQRQAGQLAGHYWFLLIPFAVLSGLVWYFYPMPSEADATYYQAHPKRRVWQPIVEVLLLVGLTVLGIRGGVQLKPLRTGHAFMQTPPILGHVALNSTFTFLKSLRAEPPERRTYFPSMAALKPALAARPPGPRPGAPRDNVVILLIESFASEYNGIENGGQGYTPFFDSLATQGLFFRQHYANGRRSIEALPAVLAGLPALTENSFITSDFQTDELHGLGELLGRQGYATSVFHGATNGTMGFNTFAGITGIQQYYGLSEYPGGTASPDFDGHWGIFDEPYLQYFAQKLGQQKQPFFSTVFTLTSHEPFPVPAQYKGKFTAGELPIHASVQYTDFALRQFFKAAARQPWYQNTLFIVLADHTSQTLRPEYQNTLGSYKTPLLLFHPGHALPAANVQRITQQADIPATVLDYLGLAPGQPLLPFGYSVFDAGTTGRALFLSGGSYFLVHSDYVAELTADNQVRLYPYQNHALPALPLAAPDPQKLRQYGNELKACVQFYLNGLADNTLYK